MAFCTKCGKPIEEGAAFCSGCGTPVAASAGAPATSSPAKTDKLKPYWYVIIWCSLLVPFFGGLIIVVLSSVMHYVWRKECPNKAKAINKHGFLAFFAGIALGLFIMAFPTLRLHYPRRSGVKEFRNEMDVSALILIPAGGFTMGSNDNDGEKPIHTVSLDAYYIGKYEVTNAQYKKFCDATGHSIPPDPDFSGMPNYFTDYPNYPVVNVSWSDAKAYCDWAGLRLPTEAEWEKAARGTDGRQYPWGNEWDGTKCNIADKNAPSTFVWADREVDDGYAYTSPVGSYPQGASPYGVMDMAGNVMEWCADWHDKNYYSQSPNNNPQGPSSGLRRVLRGSSWDGIKDDCRATNRGASDPQYRDHGVGFRCVR